MNKINNRLNGNRFIPVDSQEKTALELIKKVVDKSNEVIEQVNTFESEHSTIKETVNSFDEKVTQYNNEVLSYKQEVDKLPTINANAEVLDARCGKATLGEFNRSISSQLEHKASKNEVGTPLIASSISEMTDTTKVYVNTTDGKWYSWSGTAWTIGGTYNSQGIGDGTITVKKLNSEIKNVIFNKTTLNSNEFAKPTGLIDIEKITVSDSLLLAYEKENYNFLDMNWFEMGYCTIVVGQPPTMVASSTRRRTKAIAIPPNSERVGVLRTVKPSSSGQIVFVFLDINGNAISQVNSYSTVSDYNVLIPSGACYVLMHTYDLAGKYYLTFADTSNTFIKRLNQVVVNSNISGITSYTQITSENASQLVIPNPNKYIFEKVNGDVSREFIDHLISYDFILTNNPINEFTISYYSTTIGEITDIKSKISTIEDKISNINIPVFEDYQKEMIDNITDKLLLLQGTNTITIPFATDIHFENWQDLTKDAFKRSVKSINAIADNVNVDLCVLGGDYISNNGNTTFEIATTQINDLRSCTKELNVDTVFMKGNHDDNSIAIPTQGNSCFVSDKYRYIRQNKHCKYVGNDYYGYYDFEKEKVRVLFINTVDIPYIINGDTMTYIGNDTTAVRQEQLDFIIKALTFTESDWSVLIFTHHPLISSAIRTSGFLSPTYGGTALWGILKAFKNKTTFSNSYTHNDFGYTVNVDFSSNKSNDIICVICGHTHVDRTDVIDDIRLISTMQTQCMSYVGDNYIATDGVNYEPVANSNKETAIDIFTFDKVQRKIYATRYGVGADREFTY